MKKKLMTLILIVSACAILLPSCKKKKDEPTPEPEVNVLCDGNGSGTYYPLALNNKWSYTDGSGANKFNNSVSKTITYGSNTYYVISNSLGGTQYLRQAANGDIMTYDTGTSSEVLYIPASPTVGQSWSYNLEFAATRKVINVSAPLSTSCTYTDCLLIQTFNSGGMVAHTYYYKKGIGMLSTDEISVGINTRLNSVTLN
jgi:hypothetical protein